MNINRWLLPEGIEEVLPAEAKHLEVLRRQLLDLFAGWGYDMVIPPLVEYTESLLTGMGNDLDLQTFKLIDQRNGRMLGVRADMAPQVARIDAHRLGHDGPTRLCYIGTVLRTRGDDFGGSRSVTQIGAELYGHAGSESDIELLSLMLSMLQSCELKDVYLDLGHVSIYRSLASRAGLDSEQEATLFDALQRKAAPEINTLLSEWSLDADVSAMLASLVWLNGGAEVIVTAREKLGAADVSVHKAIDELESVASRLQTDYPEIPLHFDLAELRGYHYHTGLVFAAYQAGVGQSIAQGGRYDDVGKLFGRARPATGFSADIRTLLRLGGPTVAKSGGIFAPAINDPKLREQIRQLRQSGERVVCELPGQDDDHKYGAIVLGCDRELVLEKNHWSVRAVSD